DFDSDTNSNIDTDDYSIKTKIIPSIKAKILTKNVAFVGVPIEIGSNILGYKNETILPGKYFWNFGDGTSMMTTKPINFLHTYFYPGEYNISLEYYLRASSQSSDAITHFILKVEPLSISISKVGDMQDFFVELTNSSNNEIDISNWILNTTSRNFIFPKNSFLGANKKIIVSSRITGFIMSDKNNLKLISPRGDIISIYNSLPIQNKFTSSNITQAIKTLASEPVDVLSNNIIQNNKELDNINVEENNLPASALLGNMSDKDNSNNYLFFIIFLLLIFCATVGVYFIRRNKNSLKEYGDDFEILDE
ncbi:MAG: lamin tail domain-containing protein, partial [Candidatus Paceibacterota bacterium]